MSTIHRPRYGRPVRVPGQRRPRASERTTVVVGHYHRSKLTPRAVAQRNQARAEILAAANLVGLSLGRSTTIKGRRQLQRCVRIARQHRLVEPRILILAGFNPA